jgi:hypothetical protein
VEGDGSDVAGQFHVVFEKLAGWEPDLPARPTVLIPNEEGSGVRWWMAKSGHVPGKTEMLNMHIHPGRDGALFENLRAKFVEITK